MKIAIIGAGLTGLVAASRLVHEHEVDLYEKKAYLGVVFLPIMSIITG